ncbi:MAG: hypothetical protein R2790_06985 [Flavobacterium haoranii]
MLNFLLIVFEILLLGFLITFMHYMRKQIGYGVLYVFVGALQFFQTLLVSNVYDTSIFNYQFSPGSTIFYTASLFTILLTNYSEGIVKTRGLIYGVIISNIALTLFSHFLLIHAETNATDSGIFLEEILSFELSLFVVGTSLLFFESFFIVFTFQYLHLKMPKLNLFLIIYLTMSVVCLFDSLIFYSVFFYEKENFKQMLRKYCWKTINGNFTKHYVLYLFRIKYSKKKRFKLENNKRNS